MGRAEVRAVFAVFAASVAGCIPQRDNPHDSSRTPIATLRFADATAEDGTCLDGVVDRSTILSRTETLTINHGRCLALIGEGSRDPQSGEGDLDFQFFYVSTNGQASLAEKDEADILVVPPSMLSDMPLGTAIEFKVKVTDDSRASNSVISKLILGNEAPIPPVPHPILLPLGGYAWAPAVDFEVSFDATATLDPEGDDIEWYCWTFDDAAEICQDTPTHADFTLTVDSLTPRRLFGRFRACDVNGACSPLVTTPVLVQPEALWVRTGGASLPPGFSRLDSVRSQTDLDGPLGTPAAVKEVPGGAPRMAIVWYQGTPCEDAWVQVVPAGGRAEMDDAFYLGADLGNIASAVTDDGSRLWVLAGACGYTSETRLFGFDVNGTTLTPAVNLFVAADQDNGGSDSVRVTVASDGNVWWSSNFEGGNVNVTSPAGDPLGSFPSRSQYYSPELSSRPGSAEVWAYWGYDDALETASFTRYPSPAIETIIPLPGLSDAPAWIDADRFWMTFGTAGLAVLDAETVSAGDPQILVSAPSFGFNLIADPATGDAWGSFGSGFTVVHATLEGDVSLSVEDGIYDLFLVDRSGALWFQQNSDLWRGTTPTLSSALTSFSVPFPRASMPDGFGGVGFATFPVDWHTYAPDGAPLGAQNLSAAPGTPAIEYTPMFEMRGVPGAARGWTFAYDDMGELAGIYRLDFDASTYELLFDAAFASQIVEPVLEPSAPIAGHSEYVWMVLDQGSGSEIVTVTPEGNVSSQAPLSVAQDALTRAARSLRSNGLCLATLEETSPASLKILWVTSGGGATTIVDEQIPWSGGAMAGLAIAVSHTDTEDICWVAHKRDDLFSGPDVLHGYRTNGSLVGTADLPGEFVLSLKGDGDDAVWFGSGINGGCNCVQRMAVVGTGLVMEQSIAVDGDAFVSFESHDRFESWTQDIR